jgi:glucan phosphoethanolaminetransferase (alkaline phosphatase superfamily)
MTASIVSSSDGNREMVTVSLWVSFIGLALAICFFLYLITASIDDDDGIAIFLVMAGILFFVVGFSMSIAGMISSNYRLKALCAFIITCLSAAMYVSTTLLIAF